MERRILAGAFATALAVIVVTFVGYNAERSLVAFVLLAGLLGGFVAGIFSRTAGHVSAGARAGGYGGAGGFAAFVLVGAVQAILDGDLSVLVLGFEVILIALLVVPLYAVSGALASGVGVRVRRAIVYETAL